MARRAELGGPVVLVEVWENLKWRVPKQALKRNRRSKAVPVLGAAGLSLSLASGASASTGGPAADVIPQNTSPNHELFLGEEEISDVSLSTFYVFDHENDATLKNGVKTA